MAAERIGLEAVLDLRQFNMAYSSYVSKLGSMNTITGNTAQSLTNQFTNFGASLLKVAALLSGAVVLGAGLAAAALAKMAIGSIKEAAELEQQIANIASTMNMTTKEASFLSDVIIDLGLDPKLRVTTFEAAEAMDLLAKNGIFAGLSIQEMEQTARDAGTAVVMLSNATGAEFGQAANIATDAMVLFGMHSSQLVDIVSNITAVTTNSKFTIMDYEVALRNGGAAAAMAGVSLEHFNTMVAASAEEAGTGMKAGTGILNFMNRLTPNTIKAADAMKELGLMTADGSNRFFDATGELKDMDEIVRILNQSLFGTTKVVSEVSNRTSEQNALLAELQTEYNAAKDTIEDYTTGVSSLLATEDEKNKAISEAQAIIDKLTPTMEELIAVDSTYVESLQKLTAEQRMVAIETIFGNDAMKVAIALAKEGKQVTGDLARVTRAYGVSHQEAALMIQNGLTEYELLMQEMSNTDAIQNSETRMDTLKGKIEILGGIFEAFRIRFGSQFLELFTQIAEKLQDVADDERIVKFVENLGSSIADLIGALLQGEAPLESFKQFLTDIGQDDLATRIQEMVTSIQNFVTPIVQFVQQHSDAFIGALKGIGIALLGIMGFTVVATTLSALLSPVGLLIIAAGALGAAWETNFLNIQDVTRNVVSAVTGFLDEIGVAQFIEELKGAFSDGGLSGLANGIPKALSNLGGNISSAFQGWFSGIDWVAIGTTIIESLFSAMETAGESVGNLLNMFSAWVQTVDWETLGTQIVDYLVGAIGILLAASAVQFMALYEFFATVIETTDWVTLADSVWTALSGLFVGIFGRLEEVEQEIQDSIAENVIAPMLTKFADERDRIIVEVRDNVVLAIKEAIGFLSEEVLEPLGLFFQTIWDWVMGITWEDIGYWITTAFLTVFIGFPVTILETLYTWWMTFWNWVTTNDWESLGNNIVTRIDQTLKMFPIIVAITLATWWTAVKAWFTDTDWESQGESVITRINDALKKFWDTAKTTFDSWWTNIKDWWGGISWSTLGTDIMDGIISGIQSRAQDAINAIKGVGSGVKEAWDDFWGNQSPSKLMTQSGQYIMEGVQIGMEQRAMAAMETISQIGSEMFSGFNSSINNVLPNAPVGQSPVSNTNSTTNNFNVNNDFLGNPQITDANSLQMTLAGFK